MPNIKLRTNDQKVYEVDYDIIKLSPTLVEILNKRNPENPELNVNISEIYLRNVDSFPLELVMEWCSHHKDDAFNDDMAKLISPSDYPLFDFWDNCFIEKVDESLLFELMMSAHYLKVDPLVDITAKAIAKLVVCKTPEDIRLKWNIKNDFNPEEEEYLRRVNEWAEIQASVEPNSILMSQFLEKDCEIPEDDD